MSLISSSSSKPKRNLLNFENLKKVEDENKNEVVSLILNKPKIREQIVESSDLPPSIIPKVEIKTSKQKKKSISSSDSSELSETDSLESTPSEKEKDKRRQIKMKKKAKKCISLCFLPIMICTLLKKMIE